MIVILLLNTTSIEKELIATLIVPILLVALIIYHSYSKKTNDLFSDKVKEVLFWETENWDLSRDEVDAILERINECLEEGN